ncbi:MAG: hypothetical protein WC562_09060, partial [Dehalococcoidia bacterium]
MKRQITCCLGFLFMLSIVLVAASCSTTETIPTPTTTPTSTPATPYVKEEFPLYTNSLEQNYPSISGDIVVWSEQSNSDGWQSDAYYIGKAYYLNLSVGTNILITTNSASQWMPAVSGDIIVWMDNRNGSWQNGIWDIYGYNITTDTEFPICVDSASQRHPAISGDIVVWEDGRNRNGNYNSDIYGY